MLCPNTVTGSRGDRPLPGGDFPVQGFDALVDELGREYPWLERQHCRRLARAYGTRAEAVLGNAQSAADLGRDFGAGLTASEIDYLVAQEWARTAEDILWRRSKLGLHAPAEAEGAVRAYLDGGNNA